MKILLIVLGVVALVGLVGAAAFVALGPDRVWRLVGPPDLGDVDFATLRRRASPNDALACPPGLCAADSDIAPPTFAMAAEDLRGMFETMLAAEPRLEKVAESPDRLTQRYVQRSKLMGYPDTIVVRFVDLPEGGASVALYSRSQLGESDLGVNRARLERWLGAVQARAAQ